MSIQIPPELNWVVEIAAGQSWPQGDEDQLSELGDVWYTTRDQLADVNAQIAPMADGLHDGVSGPAAEQFGAFVKQLNDTMPVLVATTGQLGGMSKDTAVQVQYSKLMILAQLMWMAEQIIEWSSTIWGLAVVPEIEAVGRLVIQQIAKRFAMSVISATAIQTGMDAAVQAFQMFVLKDRTHWDTSSTIGAVEMGALAGGVGGVFHEVAHIVAPDLTKELGGKLILAGATGVTVAGISNGVFGANQDLGLAFASGAAGSMFAGRGGRGGKEEPPKEPPIDLSALKQLAALAHGFKEPEPPDDGGNGGGGGGGGRGTGGGLPGFEPPAGKTPEPNGTKVPEPNGTKVAEPNGTKVPEPIVEPVVVDPVGGRAIEPPPENEVRQEAEVPPVPAPEVRQQTEVPPPAPEVRQESEVPPPAPEVRQESEQPAAPPPEAHQQTETPQPAPQVHQQTGPAPVPAPEAHQAGPAPLPVDTARSTAPATYRFPPPAADPHTWTSHPESAPQRIDSFDDSTHAASFLSHYGTGKGTTLHLQDETAPGAADQARAARALVPDSNGRYTVAAHGDSGHVSVGGHDLGPKAFAQLIREHPDYEQIQQSGLRLIICDTGATPADGQHPFAQQVANELGIHVAAPTNKVWTSHDGVAMVAEPDPLRPGFPKYGSQGVFHDFAPTTAHAPAVEQAPAIQRATEPTGQTPQTRTTTPAVTRTSEPSPQRTSTDHSATEPAPQRQTVSEPPPQRQPADRSAEPAPQRQPADPAAQPAALRQPADHQVTESSPLRQPADPAAQPAPLRQPADHQVTESSPQRPPTDHLTTESSPQNSGHQQAPQPGHQQARPPGRQQTPPPGHQTSAPANHQPAAPANRPAPQPPRHPLPDTTHHPAEAALTDGADHPRWHSDVVQWSPPYDPAARNPADNTLTQPLVPWYNRPAAPGGTHALGDLSIVSTGRPHDPAAQSHTLLNTLKAANLTDSHGANTGSTAAGHITPRLARDFEHEVTKALETTDPHEWEKHLRSGITVGDGDTVVRARFRLTGGAEAPPARDPDPVLREFLSKYGDIAQDQTEVVDKTRGMGFLAEYMKTFTSKLTSLTIMVRPSVSITSKTMHSLAHEVQLGSRATNGPRVGVAHQVRIEVEAHTAAGHTAAATHDVTGKDVTAAYPAAYGAGAPDGTHVITATDPKAMERYDYTLGALDTKPLEDAYLKALIGPGKVSPHRAAEVVHGAAEEVLDEKSFRDRAQAAFTDSLPANFVRTKGFAGYTGLKAELVSVERVGSTTDGGIRNDIAETVTVKHTTEHGQGVGIRVGPEFGFVEGVTATVDAFEGSMSSKHGVGTQVQGQAKTAVIHDGDKVRYKAVFRVTGRVDADRRFQADLSRSPSVITFHSDVVGELMVPNHQAAAFERDIARAAPPVPVPTRAPVTAAGARLAQNRTGGAPSRTPGVKGISAADHPKTYQKLLKLNAGNQSRSTPFPRGGLADGHDNQALYQHLQTSGGQAAIHVEPNHAFTPNELQQLHDLQTNHGVRVFEPTNDPAHPYRELTITHNPPPAPLADGSIPLGPHLPPHTTAWADSDHAAAFSQPRGYHLDANGVTHGWSDQGFSQPNPHRVTAPPARVAPPVENIHTVADLGSRGPTADGAPPRDLGLVAPPRPGAALRTSLDAVQADPHLTVRNLPSEHDILGNPHLPDEGYVLNPAGHVVWGWRDGGPNAWGGDDAGRHGALVDLTRQAGRTGLQLVVPRGSRFETDLRNAAATLRPDNWHHDPQALNDRRDLQNRISTARENDGAGLDHMSNDDLLKMLVSDRSVRIVDEHGIATHDLNTRETVREVVQRDPAGHETGRQTVVVSNKPVDTSLKLGEERAIRTSDGRPLRTVAWKDDGTQTPYVRRAVHESDPQKETPELVAGVGLGSAAVKEMPRSEQIHATARGLISDLSSNMKGMRRGLAPTDPKSTARHDSHPARLRYRVDKQLQLALGTPKLRGARGRGFDAGHQEEITYKGRKYQISVEQVMLDRPHGDIPSDPDVAIDHQTKGTRGGGASTTRAWKVGGGGGIAGRVELPHGGAIDLGDFSGGVSGGKTHAQADGTASKNYSRLRAPKGDAFRPEYDTRYQVTVTETKTRFGFTSRRSASRIIEGDGATLPALVPSALRPTRAVADTPAYIQAHKTVAANIGRTSVLSRAEYQDLKNHPDVIDFGKTGTDGLHATFAGLDKAVRSSADFVISQAKAQHPEIPASAWKHPTYVAEVERALSEGFLRSNQPRLLSDSGIPIPLPKEFHWGPGLPNYERSFTVKGFFLRADPAAGHEAPSAANESYAEHDLKQTDNKTAHVNYKVSGAVGGAYRHNVDTAGKDESGGSGDATSGEHGNGNEPAASTTKRGVADQIGASVGVEASGTIKSRTESTTKGSIDVSLLTENTGEHFGRAHLVLEVTSNRQPVDAGMINGFLGKHLRPAAYDTTPQSHHLLIEHAAEVSMSTTLHQDVSTLHGDPTANPPVPPQPTHLDPPPKAAQPIHLTRYGAAMAAGYGTHFDDHSAVFEESGPKHPGGAVTLPAGTGILGAIKHGLQTTGSVGDEHLTDASDVWRSMSHKFDPGELKTHPDDLFDTGVTHRSEFPGPAGSTTQVTVRVTAEHADTDHIRSRDRGAVTFGGQSLKQHGSSKNSAHDFSVTGKVEGQFTKDGHAGGASDLGIKWSTGVEKSTGTQAVVRDIRRTSAAVRPKGGPTPARTATETAEQTKEREDRTPTSGEGEEFAHKLNLKIEIYVGHEIPEPLARFPNTSVSRTPPTPVVTLRTSPPPGSHAPTHITMRNVVPHHFADDGPPPHGPAPAPRPPAVRATAAGERVQPSTLDHELADHLQGLSFPDLGHVAAWAPAVTLPRSKATPFMDGTGAGLGGTPAPPHLGRYAPHNDLGVRLNTSLANRNVRDNAPDLFRGQFELPSPHGEPVKLGAQIEGVIRPVGDPAKYNGMTFTERADEPTFVESKGSGWSTDGALGGKTNDGAGVPSGSSDSRRGVETEANIGDYVEYNRMYSQNSHIYGGKVSYLLTGPHDWSMKIDSAKDFEGLLPEGWAVQMAQNHPTQVVHPHAKPLSDDSATRTTQINTLSTTPPPDGQPHRVVADLNGTSSADDHLRAARDLALAANRPVDLTLVHYTGGSADHLEHHVFDPADAGHQGAVDDAAHQRTLDAQQPARAQTLRDEQQSQQQTNLRNAPILQQGRDADQALQDHRTQYPGDLQQRVTDLDQAHQQAQQALNQDRANKQPAQPGQPAPPPDPVLVQAEHDTRTQLAEAQRISADRTRLEGDVNRLAPAVDAATRENQAAQVRVDTAQASVDEIPAAATQAATSHAGSTGTAHATGTSQTETAEHRDDLSGSATPQDAVRAAWQPTPSGFAIPRDNTDLASAMQRPQQRETLTISIGAPPTATGGYSVRGAAATRDQMAAAIIEQLAASPDPVPRRLFIEGDGSAALARAISTENQRRTAANQALPAGGAPAAVLPPVDVIGVRGTVAQLTDGGSLAGWVTGLGDRFLHQGANSPGLVVYRDGRPVRLAPYPDLASLLAALDAPPKVPRRPWIGGGS